MKNNMKHILIITMIGTMGFSTLSRAQTSYKLVSSPDVVIKVSAMHTIG